jgi:anti-anti-sigma factor
MESTVGFSVSTRRDGAVMVVRINGSVMQAEAEALYEMFRDLLVKGQKRFLLNLSSVTHLDSSGIGALARAFVMVRKADGEFKMVHLTKQVQRLMEITNLSKIFEDFSDEESALGSFR